MRRLTWIALAALLACGPVRAWAQTIDARALFRVFLKDGRALPAYGEAATVGDRVVFSLAIGAGSAVHVELMSLPLTSVDLDRTASYARSVRAAYYGATTGEADYRALTADVAQTIDTLKTVTDPAERVRIAENARGRLIDWSRDHYDYRAADIRALAEQFEPILGALRAQAGLSQQSLEFVAGSALASPLLPPPDLRTSIEAALAAARAADDPADRESVLRGALDATAGDAAFADLRGDVQHRLDADLDADRAYAALSTELLGRADAAVRTADVSAAEAVLASLDGRDRALGSVRPRARQALADALAARLESVRVFRKALDRYALEKPKLLSYERSVRSVLSGLDGLSPVLEAIRVAGPAGVATTSQALAKLDGYAASARAIDPPADLATVHAALESAIYLAHEACAAHRRVLVAPDAAMEGQASASAAGALLLLAQMRRDLVARLFPPTHP